MESRVRVLGPGNGRVPANVLFLAEAPGRLGADKTGIPLKGDRTGDIFEHLLASIAWEREDIFISNAVLCNPQTPEGLNDKPNKSEIRNCSTLLAATIEVVNPRYIVTLGATALASLSHIHFHKYKLKEHVRTVLPWHDRYVIPMYHPGPRALVHRNMLNMESDFQRLKEVIGDPKNPKRFDPFKRRKSYKNKVSRPKNDTLIDAVAWLVKALQPISLFRLHKLLYLAEVESRELYSVPLTSTFFIRQKDGPFAPEITRVVQYLEEQNLLGPVFDGSNVPTLMANRHAEPANLSESQWDVLHSISRKYGTFNNRQIKIASYMRGPMREVVKDQKRGKNTYNKPLFPDA